MTGKIMIGIPDHHLLITVVISIPAGRQAALIGGIDYGNQIFRNHKRPARAGSVFPGRHKDSDPGKDNYEPAC